jgi:hypothetical protein
MKWFRFYDEFLDDPKVAMMSDSDQLLWVKALCLANSDKRRGFITLSEDEICWKLRISIEQWKSVVDKFRAKGMIEHCEGGYKITNWGSRQFCSDSSAERVSRHRQKKKQACNVTPTVTVTPPDTETDTETDKEKEKETNQDFSFFEKNITDRGSDLGEEPTPLPPSLDAATQARLEVYREFERNLSNKDRSVPVQERYRSRPIKKEQYSVPKRPVNPWNVEESPSKFDAEFVEHLRTSKFKLIDCSASEPIDTVRVQQWLMIANNPDRDDRLALVKTAFSEFELERSRRRELATQAMKYHPDNFRGFRELSRALESFDENNMMQIYYCRHTHRNLYYGIRSIGKMYKHDIPFGKDAIKEVFECCKRLYEWADGMTIKQFAEKIGLAHWHSFFKVEEKVAA